MKYILLLIVLFLKIEISEGQAKPTYQNLVMEGGGTKGIAYGGALLELEKRGVLDNITRVAGTSAGAIQACLLAVGYTPTEIIEIVSSTPVESFNDDGFLPKGTRRLINEYGWYNGNIFHQKIEELIYKRTGKEHLTFSQLHEMAHSYPFRDLYVTGSNLSLQKLSIFSYENYPNMKLADAVRISMSIPLYYRGIWVDKEGNIFENQNDEKSLNLFVDGGLLMNYPVSIFDKQEFGADSTEFNKSTLGLKLERCLQIDHELFKKEGIAPFEITNFGSYMDALSSLVMRNANPLNKKDVSRTVYINDLDLSAKVRKVSQEEKTKMLNAGQQGVIEFFER